MGGGDGAAEDHGSLHHLSVVQGPSDEGVVPVEESDLDGGGPARVDVVDDDGEELDGQRCCVDPGPEAPRADIDDEVAVGVDLDGFATDLLQHARHLEDEVVPVGGRHDVHIEPLSCGVLGHVADRGEAEGRADIHGQGEGSERVLGQQVRVRDAEALGEEADEVVRQVGRLVGEDVAEPVRLVLGVALPPVGAQLGALAGGQLPGLGEVGVAAELDAQVVARVGARELHVGREVALELDDEVVAVLLVIHGDEDLVEAQLEVLPGGHGRWVEELRVPHVVVGHLDPPVSRSLRALALFTC